MATLSPSLVKLRSQFNELNANRDKASDGWIGDLAHCPLDGSGTSDHCPDAGGMVHAIDVDETGPWPGGLTMMQMVRTIVEDCRAGRETRLKYVIYERTIWSASWGWGAREYTGTNPHDKHAHFSGKYDSQSEQDTSDWNLGVVQVELDDVVYTAEAGNAAGVPAGPRTVRAIMAATDSRTSIMTNVGKVYLVNPKVDALVAGMDEDEERDAALQADVDALQLAAQQEATRDATQSTELAEVQEQNAAMAAELNEIQQALATLPSQLAAQIPEVTEEQVQAALNETLPTLRITQPPA